MAGIIRRSLYRKMPVTTKTNPANWSQNSFLNEGICHLSSLKDNNIEAIQMTSVRRVSRTLKKAFNFYQIYSCPWTFLVVAPIYFVMETPEKLKNAMETIINERYPYSLAGLLFICVKASTKYKCWIKNILSFPALQLVVFKEKLR